ncbi:MAG: hypothetical protein ACXAEI_11260 [Candidatus Hodarchaeales archaeon]|jgi:hypothetical protein
MANPSIFFSLNSLFGAVIETIPTAITVCHIEYREYFAAIYVWKKEFAEELRAKFDELWTNAKQLRIGME